MDYNNEHQDFLPLGGEEEPSPICSEMVALLEAGKTIADSKLYGSFRDDHLPCFNVSVTIDDKEFKFVALWVDAEYVYHLGRAPYVEESTAEIVDYIKSHFREE